MLDEGWCTKLCNFNFSQADNHGQAEIDDELFKCEGFSVRIRWAAPEARPDCHGQLFDGRRSCMTASSAVRPRCGPLPW